MPTKSYFYAILTLLVLIYTTGGCQKEKVEKINAVENRDSIAGLEVSKITTVISDSGITRYRIYTDEWKIYDKAKVSYWEFPKGILFEQFDEQLNIDATFRANYAKYLDKSKLWEFKGKVRAVNLEGKMFETEIMYWDQQEEKVYSDRFVKITLPSEIITSIGFTANQTLTKYTLTDGQGIFPLDEKEEK